MSFLGAILPGWRYHMEASFGQVGSYFLILAVGFVLSISVLHSVVGRRTSRFVLVLANALACGGFFLLAISSALQPALVRLLGLLSIGAGAGLSSAVMFRTITSAYRRESTTINVPGALLGSGCLLTALLAAGTYSMFPVAYILAGLSVLAWVAAVWFARTKRWGNGGSLVLAPSIIWRDFKDPGAVLFGLLLLFQFGNEWSIGGWLPLFLIRRLGISPRTSLAILALYWVVLLAGRLISQRLLSSANRPTLLASSIASAVLGMLVLASTNNRFGAVMGVLFVGAGFAPFFPLAIQQIRHRFPEQRAGVFSGLFSIAMVGGLLAPWLVSFFASAWGIQAVMFFAMAGVAVVTMLMLLVILEAKLSGWIELKDADSGLGSTTRIDQLDGANGIRIAQEMKK
jgi:Major Facilitator Superfamily